MDSAPSDFRAGIQQPTGPPLVQAIAVALASNAHGYGSWNNATNAVRWQAQRDAEIAVRVVQETLPKPPVCDVRWSPGCEGVLTRPGALLFGPPNERSQVKKLHVCVPCWVSVITEEELG
jgi:hypothetical protein